MRIYYRPIKAASDGVLLGKIKQFIKKFYDTNYGTSADFSDVSKVPIVVDYDGRTDKVVSRVLLDLNKYQILYEENGKIKKVIKKFTSLPEMWKALQQMNFDDFQSISVFSSKTINASKRKYNNGVKSMRIYSNKKRPVNASSDGRKWVNTELTQDEYDKFRNFLKKKGYKYETSGAGDMVHIEAYLNEAEIKEADKFLDTLDSVDGACGKKSVKASTYDSIELTFISPDLETGSSVVDKAREIGGFGSTWNEHSWVYIDVPSAQSVDNVDDLIEYAQSVGVYLNRPSAKLLDAWADSKTQTVLRGCTEKPVNASTSGNIPYDLVSMLVALRDWVSIDDTDYINDEHRKLVDVADSLYNVGISVNEMSPEYQEVYNKYGKDFFDLVLDDVAALDSQLTSNNVNDLIADYNDREASYTGVNASTKRRRNTKAIKASEVDELEDDPFINALWEACDDVPQLVEINYEATEGIIFIFNHTTDDYDGREALLINSLEAAGYDAEYLANNGSNVIVLDVKEKGVNASVTSRKAVKASELTNINGYAVQIHDMHDAMYDLLLFGNREDAEWASEQLEIISNRMDNGELDDYEYNDMISYVFNMSDDYIEEINFRTEIDRNNIWTALDDSKWQIVNPVSVSLWL